MLTCVRQSAASRAEGEATRVEGIAREVTAARARLEADIAAVKEREQAASLQVRVVAYSCDPCGESLLQL